MSTGSIPPGTGALPRLQWMSVPLCAILSSPGAPGHRDPPFHILLPPAFAEDGDHY